MPHILLGMCVLCHYVAFTVLLVPRLLEGTDSVGEQLHGNKECPFRGVTNSGRVWRKVPESNAWSMFNTDCSDIATAGSCYDG